jgi:hypothetical protein
MAWGKSEAAGKATFKAEAVQDISGIIGPWIWRLCLSCLRVVRGLV